MVATSTTQGMNVRRTKLVIVIVIVSSDTDLSRQEKLHSFEIPGARLTNVVKSTFTRLYTLKSTLILNNDIEYLITVNVTTPQSDTVIDMS